MNTGFAFGKIKKTARFCEDVDASAVFMQETLDFADIVLGRRGNSKKACAAYTETRIISIHFRRIHAISGIRKCR